MSAYRPIAISTLVLLTSFSISHAADCARPAAAANCSQPAAAPAVQPMTVLQLQAVPQTYFVPAQAQVQVQLVPQMQYVPLFVAPSYAPLPALQQQLSSCAASMNATAARAPAGASPPVQPQQDCGGGTPNPADIGPEWGAVVENIEARLTRLEERLGIIPGGRFGTATTALQAFREVFESQGVAPDVVEQARSEARQIAAALQRIAEGIRTRALKAEQAKAELTSAMEAAAGDPTRQLWSDWRDAVRRKLEQSVPAPRTENEVVDFYLELSQGLEQSSRAAQPAMQPSSAGTFDLF